MRAQIFERSTCCWSFKSLRAHSPSNTTVHWWLTLSIKIIFEMSRVMSELSIPVDIQKKALPHRHWKLFTISDTKLSLMQTAYIDLVVLANFQKPHISSILTSWDKTQFAHFLWVIQSFSGMYGKKYVQSVFQNSSKTILVTVIHELIYATYAATHKIAVR